MTFMNLNTIVFPNKKKNFQLRDFVPFIVSLLPSLFNYRPNMTKLLSREVVKGIVNTNSNVFNGIVMTLLASTRVFHNNK